MEALPLNAGGLSAIGCEVLHAMRMELCCLAVFFAVWGSGRVLRRRAATAKKVTPKTLPPTAATSRAAPEPRRRAGPSGMDFAFPTRAQLADPRWLRAAVQQQGRSQPQRSIEAYRQACKAGVDLRALGPDAGAEMFVALIWAAVRLGQPGEVRQLLVDSRTRGPGITAGMLGSATKLCTSKQYYKECLANYDYAAEDPALIIEDHSIWSCLLFCAVEARAFQRCQPFFDRLKACGAPSHKDFGNMIRCASARSSWQQALALIEEMHAAGVEVDSVAYNTALATCVAGSQFEKARELLQEMEAASGVTDVITYNTLAKGYAKAGRLDECFELFSHMRAKGIAPSQWTYGIMLDCCINERHMDKATEVFDAMIKDGCVMNTILYTTLIKGFARAYQVDKAMAVFDQMRSREGNSVTPDVITFSILIKANCDAKRMDVALKLLDTMVELELVPDEVVFNNLLGGCVHKPDVELARRFYDSMVQGGIRPSSATYSILIRVFAASRSLDEAVDMLRLEPAVRGVECEPRIYVQLVQACLRERQGRRAVEAYKLLLARSSPTAAVNGSILGACAKLHMPDTGAELLALAEAAGSRVDRTDAERLRQSALRRRAPDGRAW